jgi:hypothetical protein
MRYTLLTKVKIESSGEAWLRSKQSSQSHQGEHIAIMSPLMQHTGKGTLLLWFSCTNYTATMFISKCGTLVLALVVLNKLYGLVNRNHLKPKLRGHSQDELGTSCSDRT